MHAWLDHLSESIRRRNLIANNASVLLAISGGLDSMVLMHALHELSSKFGWHLTVAHFNHQLRGRESDEDEEFVVTSATELSLPVATGRGEVQKTALETKVSIEMAARTLRHRFLSETALQCGAESIALGHHADDQVELFFLRLFRGVGGKIGMSWRNPSPVTPSICLVRPLLDATKESLRQFALEQRIVYREDSTNTHTDILRNRVRQDLMPLLKNRYQPAIDTHILHFMEIAGEESAYVEANARDWFHGDDARPPFDLLSIAVQRQIIRFQLLKMALEPSFDLIEGLRLKPRNRISYDDNCWLLREKSGIVVFDSPLALAFRPDRVVLDISSPGKAALGELFFSWKHVDGMELDAIKERFSDSKTRPANAKNTPETSLAFISEVFDAEKIGNEIILRHWQPGDRFQPIGMHQPIKLQDLMVNAKVPTRERRQRTVGVSQKANALFFVEGLRIGELFKLDKTSNRGLIWHWQRGNPVIGRVV